MESYQIRTFVMVARQGNVTRASEALFLSQPAVSAHIKALEAEWNLTLFVRTSKGMELTPDGAALLAKAQKVLAAQGEFVAEAKTLKGKPPPRLRIGAMHCTSDTMIGRFVTHVTRMLPELEVELERGTSDQVARRAACGAIDVGLFNEGSAPPPELDLLALGRCRVYLAVPAAWKVDPAAPDWPALCAAPWIYAAAEGCAERVAKKVFESCRTWPQRTLDVGDERVVRSLVAAGAGVGLLHPQVALGAEAAGEATLLGLPSSERLVAGLQVSRQPRALVDAVRHALQALAASSVDH